MQNFTLSQFAIFILSTLIGSLSYAVPKTVTLQMKIVKPDTTALEAPAVNFQITTLDPAGVCVLYVETFGGVSMTASGGSTTINLGGGNQTYSAAGANYADVFNNLTPTLPCQSGGNYTPSSLDKRKIVIQFNDASAAGWQTLQAIDINSVPYSQFAGDAAKLAGHPYIDFALKTGFPDCNTSGKVLTYNGSSFTCVSPSAGSGTVTNVTSANAYVTIATGTTTPVVTAVVGTVANTLAAGNDSRIVGAAQKANNLSDLASVATARTNLGLGSAAVLTAGTAANNLVQLDGSAKIPAALLPSGAVTTSTALAGDVTGTIGATVVSAVGAKTAAQVAQSVTDTLAATNANTASTIVKRDASGNIAASAVSATSLSTQNNYLYDNTNTNRILLKAPTTGTTDYTLTLPPVIGTANQILGYNNAGTVLENKSITAGTGVTITHSAGGIQIATSAGAGTVTSVTSATTDIAVANTTSTPVLTLNSGTGNNQIVKLDASAKLPAVDGSALTNLDPSHLSAAVPINKGGTNATTAAAALNNLLPAQGSNANKFLQTDGTSASWVAGNAGTVTSVTSANSYLTVATTTSTPVITAVVGTAANTLAAGNDSRITGALQQSAYTGDVANVLDTNCAAGSTPKWNVATDMWSCVAIGSLDAAAITTGTLASARLGSGTANNTTYLRGDGTWSTPPSSPWTVSGNDVYYNTGNVGVGTATPLQALDVAGNVRLGKGSTTGLTMSPAVNASVTTIPVSSTATLPTSGAILIDSEIITYSGTGCGTCLTSVTRGAYGTTAAAHANNSLIYPVLLSVGGNSTSSALTLLGNGNLGVGTVPTSERLTVQGRLSGGSYPSAHYNILDLSANNGPNSDISFIMDVANNPAALLVSKQNIVGTGDTFFQAIPNTTGYGVLETWNGLGTVVGTGNSTPIIFRPNRTEAMRIQPNGRVGIGTSNPGAALEINGQIKILGGTPGANKVLTSDASGLATWEALPASSSGTVSSVTSANSYLTVATTTSTPVITAVVGTAANTLAAGDDSRITGAVQQTAYNGDLANVLDTNCGTGSTPKWNVATDMWTCVAIGSLPASAITSGTVAPARLGSGTADNTTYLRGDGAWSPLTSSQWITSGSDIYFSAGKVGIGTAPSSAALKVEGTLVTGSGHSVGTGTNQAVFGYSNNVTGTNGFSAGYLNSSAGLNGFTANYFNSANGAHSAVFGEGNYANSVDQFAVGSYGVSLAGNATVWTATDPLFTVGNGTGTGARSNALTILKNGRVGIGTTTPGTLLEVAGQIKITGGSPGANKVLTSDAAGLATWVTPAAGNAGTVTSVTSANSYLTVATTTSTPVITAVVGTAANTLAAGDDSRITGAVQQTAYNGDLANVLDTNCGTGSTPKWNVATDMWTCVAIGSLPASAIISGTIATARLGSGTADNTTFLRGDGTWATPAGGTSSQWTTGAAGIISYTGGKVGVGTATPSEALEVNGTVKATDLLLSSDQNLKTDIVPLENSLEKILMLAGVKYRWRTEQYPNRNFDSYEHMGFIAQRVAEIYPNLVHGVEGNLAVDYTGLIAPIVESIKTQNTEVVQLKRQVASLQEQNEKQQALLKMLIEKVEKLEKK